MGRKDSKTLSHNTTKIKLLYPNFPVVVVLFFFSLALNLVPFLPRDDQSLTMELGFIG